MLVRREILLLMMIFFDIADDNLFDIVLKDYVGRRDQDVRVKVFQLYLRRVGGIMVLGKEKRFKVYDWGSTEKEYINF